jgi:hypothetical protein
MKSKSADAGPQVASHDEENSIILFLRQHYHKIATFLWTSILILRYTPGLESLDLQAFTDLSYRDPSAKGARTGDFLLLKISLPK